MSTISLLSDPALQNAYLTLGFGSSQQQPSFNTVKKIHRAFLRENRSDQVHENNPDLDNRIKEVNAAYNLLKNHEDAKLGTGEEPPGQPPGVVPVDPIESDQHKRDQKADFIQSVFNLKLERESIKNDTLFWKSRIILLKNLLTETEGAVAELKGVANPIPEVAAVVDVCEKSIIPFYQRYLKLFEEQEKKARLQEEKTLAFFKKHPEFKPWNISLKGLLNEYDQLLEKTLLL